MTDGSTGERSDFERALVAEEASWVRADIFLAAGDPRASSARDAAGAAWMTAPSDYGSFSRIPRVGLQVSDSRNFAARELRPRVSTCDRSPLRRSSDSCGRWCWSRWFGGGSSRDRLDGRRSRCCQHRPGLWRNACLFLRYTRGIESRVSGIGVDPSCSADGSHDREPMDTRQPLESATQCLSHSEHRSHLLQQLPVSRYRFRPDMENAPRGPRWLAESPQVPFPRLKEQIRRK
jgi:hypothetical protein